MRALGEAQLLQQEREAGQASLFGEACRRARPRRGQRCPTCPPWTEAERLAKEKEVLGFFISGHPLERFRDEVELFGTRTTATLGEWSEHQVTRRRRWSPAVKRQISKKTGKEYARLVLEDFHGTAEAIVFPDAWAKLNQVDRAGRGAAPDRRVQRPRPGRGPGAVRRRDARPLERAQGLRARWR